MSPIFGHVPFGLACAPDCIRRLPTDNGTVVCWLSVWDHRWWHIFSKNIFYIILHLEKNTSKVSVVKNSRTIKMFVGTAYSVCNAVFSLVENCDLLEDIRTADAISATSQWQTFQNYEQPKACFVLYRSWSRQMACESFFVALPKLILAKHFYFFCYIKTSR